MMTGLKIVAALAVALPATAIAFETSTIVASVVSLILAALGALIVKQINGIERRLENLEALPERVARIEERTASNPGEGRKR